MATDKKTEVWLNGPIDGITPLLQPVAHELNVMMIDFPEELLWEMPAGMASPGFHLQHLAGVVDRLFTYAKGEQLTKEQLTYLADEGKPAGKIYNANGLLETFNRQVDLAIKQLCETDESTLTAPREVGRARLPSTVIGLLIHAAEHTMRHTGQLLVTINVLKAR
jgi:uncharacterized damage-inducible protein DinB